MKSIQLRNGFSLISVMAAVLISSILIVALTQSLRQLSFQYANLSDRTHIDTKFLVLHQLFERDFSGVYVLKIMKPSKPEDQEKKKDVAENSEKKVNSKNEKELIKRVFYCENQQNNLLENLTFITTNAIPSYQKARPRLVRVTYTLESDKENLGSYILYRQESYALTSDPTKEVIEKKTEEEEKLYKKYELFDKIVSFEMIFFAQKNIEEEEIKKQDKSKKIEKKKQEKIEIIQKNDWKHTDNVQKKEGEKEPFPFVPSLVQVTIGFLNAQKKTVKITASYPIGYHLPPCIIQNAVSKPEAPKEGSEDAAT